MVSLITEKLQRQSLTDKTKLQQPVKSLTPSPSLLQHDREKENLCSGAASINNNGANVPSKMAVRLGCSPSLSRRYHHISSSTGSGSISEDMGLPPLPHSVLPQQSQGLPSRSLRTSKVGTPGSSSSVNPASMSATDLPLQQPPSPPLLPPKRQCRSLSLTGEVRRPVPLRPSAAAASGGVFCLIQPAQSMALPHRHTPEVAPPPAPPVSRPQSSDSSSGFHDTPAPECLSPHSLQDQSFTLPESYIMEPRSHSQPNFAPSQNKRKLRDTGLHLHSHCRSYLIGLPQIASSPLHNGRCSDSSGRDSATDITPTNSTDAELVLDDLEREVEFEAAAASDSENFFQPLRPDSGRAWSTDIDIDQIEQDD